MPERAVSAGRRREFVFVFICGVLQIWRHGVC